MEPGRRTSFLHALPLFFDQAAWCRRGCGNRCQVGRRGQRPTVSPKRRSILISTAKSSLWFDTNFSFSLRSADAIYEALDAMATWSKAIRTFRGMLRPKPVRQVKKTKVKHSEASQGRTLSSIRWEPYPRQRWSGPLR